MKSRLALWQTCSSALLGAVAAAIVLLTLPSTAFGQPRGEGAPAPGATAPPENSPAPITPAATSAHLFRVTRAGDRLVSVGERGIVLLSDDRGTTWRQATVPVSVTITSVTFVTPKSGWAVGHAGVVLHTEDGGESWTRKLEGRQVAEMTLRSAEEKLKQTGNDETVQKAYERAKRFVAEGADKPFFDVFFPTEKSGFIVGAYGLILHTEDAGNSWQSWMWHVENPSDQHLYSIRGNGQVIYIAGERGLLLRSKDSGNSFKRLSTPFQGSYFAVTPSGQHGVIVAGLLGTAFRSLDEGESFAPIAVPVPVSIVAATQRPDGTVVLLNQNGQLFNLAVDALNARPIPSSSYPTYSVSDIGGGSLMTVGVKGATIIGRDLPAR